MATGGSAIAIAIAIAMRGSAFLLTRGVTHLPRGRVTKSAARR